MKIGFAYNPNTLQS